MIKRKIEDYLCLEDFHKKRKEYIQICEDVQIACKICNLQSLYREIKIDKVIEERPRELHPLAEDFIKRIGPYGDGKRIERDASAVKMCLNHKEITFYTWFNLIDYSDQFWLPDFDQFMEDVRFLGFEASCFHERKNLDKKKWKPLFYKPFSDMFFMSWQRDFMYDQMEEEGRYEVAVDILPESAKYLSKLLNKKGGQISVVENLTDDLTICKEV